MAGLSKFVSSSLVRSTLGRLHNPRILLGQIRHGGGHARVFRKRPGILFYNKIKDALHFYICLPILPIGFLWLLFGVIFGECELREIPEDGEPPHYWQYERTVFRQLWAKYLGYSDVEWHEAIMAKYVKDATLQRWRRLDKRVKHLQGERLDYKGFHYRPITASWLELGDTLQKRINVQYEQHGRNSPTS